MYLLISTTSIINSLINLLQLVYTNMSNLEATYNKESPAYYILFYITLTLTGLLSLPGMVSAQQAQVIGWIESVNIEDAQLNIQAKIDTGADTTSIDAVIEEIFQVEDEDWIRFSITNKQNKTVTLDRKIIRYVEIKRRLVPPVKRPVVELGICLGQTYHKVNVNLANRAKFNYKMLIGRDYLEGRYLVDSASKYTTQPSCRFIREMDKVNTNE